MLDLGGDDEWEARYDDERDAWLRELAGVPRNTQLRVVEEVAPNIKGGPYRFVFVGTEPDDFRWGSYRPVWTNRQGDLEVQIWFALVYCEAQGNGPLAQIVWGPRGEKDESLHELGDVQSVDDLAPALAGLLVLRGRLPPRLGAPRGIREWPLEYFKPNFERVWRQVAAHAKRRPEQLEVKEAMRPKISKSTFERRWRAAYPGKRWDELTF